MSHYYYFLKCLFTYFERKRGVELEGQTEGERESEAGSVLSVQSPMWGSISGNVRSWPHQNQELDA